MPQHAIDPTVSQDSLMDDYLSGMASYVPVAATVRGISTLSQEEDLESLASPATSAEICAALKIQKVMTGCWGRREAQTKRWARKVLKLILLPF